ncbi:NAD-dependent protein deacetylase sirtuin-2 isoform X1 [Vespa velutina]|uniref:NAD-dependent protein deacetylase sirtuin-2 isoform X1 n=2 Tax=Vespa velutina TaxID=202808 RepID=UPI001FB4E8CB|nr:NAD-dependent protein deacetylase sirtuin-2 isoform X1 [Vespa velutina]XP_047371518.1 NAD-dependent protein deacetylase sirtuin-2 isoform X1 [Vespa velutina]
MIGYYCVGFRYFQISHLNLLFSPRLLYVQLTKIDIFKKRNLKNRLIDNNPDEDKPGPSSENTETETEGEDSGMEKIRKYLIQKLKLYDSDTEQESCSGVLKELTIDGIIDYIKQNPKCKIITMAGAGISTSAGIPDFRSPSSGLYHNLEKYNLPHPQAVFELDFFMENPEPFFTLAKQLLPEGFKPTPCHYFIRLLWEKGLLLRHYTQNIDTLERIAGLPAEKLIEAHGTFHTGHCLKCRAPYTLEWMKEKILESVIPKCEECEEGVVKPDVVFFGEMLPERFHYFADRDFIHADLLIIMGSSLVVQPFASLIDRVRPSCPRLLINKEKAGMQDRLSRFLGLRQGLIFDSKNSNSGRDVAWLGDCDTGCQLLADKLGWGEELKALIKREHERLDAENSNIKNS